MKKKKKRVILSVILIMAIVNYSRIAGNEHVRAVQFISIFAIGGITALLIDEMVREFRNLPKEK